MSELKNIIFDFGGVLIDLDVAKTFVALSETLEMEVDAALFQKHQQLFDDFEKGDVSSETFLWRFQYISKKVPPAHEVIKAWNAMLVGWNLDKLKFLEDISKKYNIYLLSNTNEIHLQWIYRDLKNNHQISDFDSRFFKKTYYSHLIRMRKPDVNIFEYILKDAKLLPHETVFIDDMQVNIDAAGKIGLPAIHHKTNDPLSEQYILDHWQNN